MTATAAAVPRMRAIACRVQNLTIGTAERLHRFQARRCPCCGWMGLRFRSFTVVEATRHGVICPACGSFERHRALASFYPSFFRAWNLRPSRLIHCAPERCLGRVLAGVCEAYETSAYGEGTPADHRLDLTAMALPDASCDALVLNHVLDCMDGDLAAAREMHRVLRPGGIVLAVVTFGPPGATREVPVLSTGLRRLYGGDLARRFAPFDVTTLDAVADVAVDVRRLHGLPDRLPVVVMSKPRPGVRA